MSTIALKTVHCMKCPQGSASLDVAEFLEHYLRVHLSFTLIKCNKCGKCFGSPIFGSLHKCNNKKLELDVDLSSELVGERLLAAHIALNEGMKASMAVAFALFKEENDATNKVLIQKEITKGVQAELKRREDDLNRKKSFIASCGVQPTGSSRANDLSNDERQLQECYGKRFSVDKKSEHHKKRARLEERNEGALTNLLTQVKQIPTLQQKLQQQQQEESHTASCSSRDEIQLVDTTDHSETVFVSENTTDEVVTTVEYHRNRSHGKSTKHKPSHYSSKKLAGRVSWPNKNL